MQAQPTPISKPELAFNPGDEVAVVDLKSGKAVGLRTVERLWHTGDVLFGPTGTRYRQDGSEIVYAERVYDDRALYRSYDYDFDDISRPYREIMHPARTCIRHPTDEDRAEIARIRAEEERRALKAQRIEEIRSMARRSGPYETRPTLDGLTDDQIARIHAIINEPCVEPQDG